MIIPPKLGASAVFLLDIVDIIFDCVRTYYTTRAGSVATSNLWDILELTIAVMLSALTNYQQLFSTLVGGRWRGHGAVGTGLRGTFGRGTRRCGVSMEGK